MPLKTLDLSAENVAGDLLNDTHNETYERLARYLDSLPCGFPRTPSGVEMRILRRMFTPEEAALMVHITLLPEDARAIARRAGLSVEETDRRLEGMNQKGLLYSMAEEGKPTRYITQQFAIGFWEGQVNRLDPELARDCEEYLSTFADPEVWRKMPQLRTIPVGASLNVTTSVLPYEAAEDLVRRQTKFAVANCVCRQERGLVVGHTCDKPMESCLAFGGVAEHYMRVGRGREITMDEAIGLLHQAEEAGLVLQPTNDRDPVAICMCCGCCCVALNLIKKHEHPASVASSAFVAHHNPLTCIGCGTCEQRCQMGAMVLENGIASMKAERCIGCGLCVTTCPTDSLKLERKPEETQPYVPRSMAEALIRLSLARGKALPLLDMAVRAGIGWLRNRFA